MKIAIYALCERDRIRYVGRTFDVRLRYVQHLSERTSSPKCEWICGLLARGERPALRVLEEVPAHEAPRAELRWIRRLHRRGFELVNVQGTGRPRRPAVSAQRRDRSVDGLVELWRQRSSVRGLYQARRRELAVV